MYQSYESCCNVGHNLLFQIISVSDSVTFRLRKQFRPPLTELPAHVRTYLTNIYIAPS